jgi:hypothetical protein
VSPASRRGPPCGIFCHERWQPTPPCSRRKTA